MGEAFYRSVAMLRILVPQIVPKTQDKQSDKSRGAEFLPLLKWHSRSKLVAGGWGQAVGIRPEWLTVPDMVQYSVDIPGQRVCRLVGDNLPNRTVRCECLMLPCNLPEWYHGIVRRPARVLSLGERVDERFQQTVQLSDILGNIINTNQIAVSESSGV
ncbi:hypothetical protein AAG570_007522 [Ranatra chinensis]|uniref:Uncharacterized protein n=1 Tax=Ranatra chinensis TaxID=642074 RepID=A0ABD0XWF6_9HEMI